MRTRYRQVKMLSSDGSPHTKRSPNPKRYQTHHPKALAIDKKEWRRIVDVYRRWDCRLSIVAEALGWPEPRVRRMWNKGYPTLGYPPIKTLLARDAFAVEEIRAKRHQLRKELPPEVVATTPEEVEQKAEIIMQGESARIRRLVEIEDERAAARADAVASRAEEALLISLNRKNTLALNGLTSKILRGAAVLAENIEVELAKEAKSKKLSLTDKMTLLRTATQVARFNSEATMLAVKAERLVLGHPIEAIDDQSHKDDQGLQETERWLHTTMKLLERARDRGVIALQPDAKPEAAEKAG